MVNTIYINYAAGYVRCSTDMQDGSIEQQKNELLKWAEKSKLKIIRWFEDDGKSGTSFLKRPGFFRMKTEIEGTPDFHYVLVYDESRWGRPGDPRENTYWKMHFKRYGVTVKVINSSSQNGNDIGSFVVEVVEGAEASEYSKKLSRSTLRGQKSNALQGFSSGGSAPFGFKRIAVNKVSGEFIRELKPGMRSYPDEKVLFELGEPHEVEVVKKIFELKLQGLGYMKIANILNSEGISCPRRGRWKNKNQMWSLNTICTIITNPTYAGLRVFNRHPQSHIAGPSKKVWFNDPSEWVIKENAHPAIITPEKFNELHKLRKPYKRTNRFYYESPYLLSGLLKCSSCGFNFQGQTRKLKSKKSGEEYSLSYYEDGGYAGKGNSVCRSYLLRKDKLEDFVIKKIKEYISEENFLEKVFVNIESKLLNNSNNDSLLSSYSKQIENNKTALKNLLELISNGVGLQEVKDEVYRINKEIEYLQKGFDEIKYRTIDRNDINSVVSKTKELINNFESTFSNAELHIQKTIIRQFIEEIFVDPHHGSIECKFRKVPWVDSIISTKNIYGLDEIKLNLD